MSFFVWQIYACGKSCNIIRCKGDKEMDISIIINGSCTVRKTATKLTLYLDKLVYLTRKKCQMTYFYSLFDTKTPILNVSSMNIH